MTATSWQLNGQSQAVAAGGPMAGLSGLIGKFLGVESAAIEFHDKDGHYSVKAGNLVDIAGQPALGIDSQQHHAAPAVEHRPPRGESRQRRSRDEQPR